jgi:hypothetical protein
MWAQICKVGNRINRNQDHPRCFLTILDEPPTIKSIKEDSK